MECGTNRQEKLVFLFHALIFSSKENQSTEHVERDNDHNITSKTRRTGGNLANENVFCNVGVLTFRLRASNIVRSLPLQEEALLSQVYRPRKHST